MTFTSYHATSDTSPVNPSSGMIKSATITSVWPRSSRRSSPIRIHRHHGAVAHRELGEERNEHAQRRAAAIRVRDRDDGRIRRRHVVARARQPGLAGGDEVELLTIDNRPAVRLVV